MKTFIDADKTLIVLEKGEELIESLTRYAREHNVQGAWVSVIGGSSELTLGYRDTSKKEYIWQEYAEPLEITGLQGNLAFIDGEPSWHIHGTFSRPDYSVIGGHVKRCSIGLTGEILLQTHGTKVERKHDEDTGLNLITGEAQL